MAPCFYKPKNDLEPVGDVEETCDRQTSPVVERSEEPERKQTIHAFRVVHVFDVSQTEGEPLPECPHWRDFEKDRDLENSLLLFAGEKSIDVEIMDDLGGPEGVSSGGKIRLLRTTGTRTLVHELAYELFEHANPDNRGQMTSQQREIETDAVAYVVGRHFGLKADSAPNYLALWQAAGKDILACLERVRGIAVEIIQAVENHQPHGEAKEAI